MGEKHETKREPVIETENLHKTFYIGKNRIRALRGVDFKVEVADFVVIFGPSGCGKTTLLNIIAGIDKPTSGKVLVRGTDIFALNEEKRGLFRAKKMGMIHQMPYWVKSLNVLENVALPLIIEGENASNALHHAKKVLRELGIDNLAKQRPTQLSGGEQQKASFARALVTNPWIILADEPTGNLDSESAAEIMDLLKLLNRKYRRTIVLVTHNDRYWQFGTERIEMKDGLIVRDVNHG
jgi:putative ABC transport system ATP-binding protein